MQSLQTIEIDSNNSSNIQINETDHIINITSNFNQTLKVTSSQFNLSFYLELVFGTKSNFGWILKIAMPTGWILLLILTIMIICSLPFIRRKGHFQVFFSFYHKLTK
jgi:hypothetical protein